MKNKYKIPWHVRQYVKKELMDYKSNKKLIAKYKGDTRGLILANMRLKQIENVLNSLNKEDREAAELIFIDKYTQSGAEIARGLSKAAYYNAMNKVIYLVAVEMDLI
nr:MAG TPA: Protein of unknown function (DUF722) [Caudoviricetes sp.]